MSEKVKIKVDRDIMRMPTIALRGLVVFPNNVVHFEVGREKSIAAVEWAMSNSSHIFLITQREMDTETPTVEDLYEYGVVAEVKQVLRVSDDVVKVLVEGKTRAITLAASASRRAAEERAPRADQVPILGSVAAGAPILAEECIEDYLTFDTQGKAGEYFALKVRGESMLNAGILPGDLVVVHRQPEAHSGEIVVALFEDEATVKTLRRRDGQTWLMPANDDYQPIDGTYAQILGKVVAVVRRY